MQASTSMNKRKIIFKNQRKIINQSVKEMKGGNNRVSVQFSSVQSLKGLGRRGDMTDSSAEILLQSFLQEALLSSSGMGRDVHFFMLSIQHFLCRPGRRPPTKMRWRMVLEMLSWRVTCPKHASFRLLTVARRSSCGPTMKLILLRTQSLVLCSKEKIRRSFLRHLSQHVNKPLIDRKK